MVVKYMCNDDKELVYILVQCDCAWNFICCDALTVSVNYLAQNPG